MTIYELLGEEKKTIADIIKNKHRYYLSYGIKKRRGRSRRIDAPQQQLADVQNKILYKILYKYKPHPIAYGFVKDRGPKENAEKHVGAEILITIDIKNFFNSITEKEVWSTLEFLFNKKLPYDTATTDDIGVIVQLLTYRGRVPQGAASSPAISNLFMLPFDKQLKKLQSKYEVIITRYADDIAISSKKKPTFKVKDLLDDIREILRPAGLRMNKSKTKIRKRYHRMKVTGIVVNEKPNIPRENWRNFRACLHNIKTKEPIEKVSEEDRQKLRGYIEWVKTINPTRGKQFLKQYEEICSMQEKLFTNI
jgi:retron-type reverse transcriptase